MNKLGTMTTSVLLISIFLLGSAKASGCSLNLPPNPVTMTIYDGTISYFNVILSNVPSGYNVTNGNYRGWCNDIRYDIPRDTDFRVMLYSSCAPPAGLVGERWDMINYILNHKQGEMMDIQQAIWYFMKYPDGTPEAAWRPEYSPTPAAQAIVDDAVANGAGFVPGPGDRMAVICYPEEETQIPIIELRVRAPKSVGGKSTPISIPTTKPQPQTPWMWLTTIILPLVATAVFMKLKKKKQ